MKNKNLKKQFYFLASALIFMCAVSVSAQTTAFNYQGKLTDAGNPASGNYLLQFKLFDAAADGTQIGATLSDVAVVAANGVFNTSLDFGAAAFDGTDRFLEIAVKKNAGDSYTVLSPRQKINSAPYAVKSKSADEANNAAQLGGVAADEYVTTASVGNSFVKNSTTTQTGANFNISGNGVVGGTLGVGMNPGGFKFSVNGAGQFRPRGNDDSSIGFFSKVTGNVPTIALSTSDGSKGEMRLQGGSLKLVTGFGFGDPEEGITIQRFGNVGIGTTPPNTRLTLSGGPMWTSNGWTASMNLQNASALGWEANASGQRFGIGQSNGGLYFFRTGSAFGTNGTPAIYDLVITDTGITKMKVLQITGGSDLAENFELVETVKPGTVVAIDPQNAGKLIVARGAYNRRVAGVISGANNLSAGMLLPDLENAKNSMPVALSGRVWVYADATKNPIKPGDLLTTSDAPGYAMKVTNHKKANGAIIGKAMTELKSGTGLVLVLVTLQ